MERKIKILLAKCGRDGHSRGMTVVAYALRNAGMEVVPLGLHRTPEEVVAAAIQESVDIIGLSQLDGGHMAAFRGVAGLLREKNADEIALIGGGVVPGDEVSELKKIGVAEIFGPGTPLNNIVEYIQHMMRSKHEERLETAPNDP